MTSNGNVQVLTTCTACLAHALRIAERNFEEKISSSSSSTNNKNKNDDDSAEVQEAKQEMKQFLELLQKEAVPFVGAAYDHFAEENEDLEMIADAFLRSLGDRIRKQYYSVPQ